MGKKVELELSEQAIRIFDVFANQLKHDEDSFHKPDDATELMESFLESLSDGIRRSGSWERGLITQLTGWDDYLDIDENIHPDHSNPNDKRSAAYGRK